MSDQQEPLPSVEVYDTFLGIPVGKKHAATAEELGLTEGPDGTWVPL
jgi:hypothetical protein